MSSLRQRAEILAKSFVDLSGDVPLETANHLSLAEPLLESSGCVGAGASAVAQSHHSDHVQRGVGIAITAGV